MDALPKKEIYTEQMSNSDDLAHYFSLNSSIDGEPNKYLIFGNVPDVQHGPDILLELSVFLGRWEGYDFSPPVAKDIKIVLFIQKIDEKGGEGLIWYASNLQYPEGVRKFDFIINKGENPEVVFNLFNNLFRFKYDSSDNCLVSAQIKLTRDKTFCVYGDYPAYLESKRIYVQKYKDMNLNIYGQGYMLYLPQGYDEKPDKDWPLLMFFCGTGDRGRNAYVLAKSSPFMYIREKGDLPCIIVAPAVDVSSEFRSFPGKYMEGVLNEIIKNYRVDKKRIYITGLSMGGEAAYRFALLKPDKVAAVLVLCGALAIDIAESFYQEAQEIENVPLSVIKDVPIWAVHGDIDTLIPFAFAQRTIDRFKEAGAEIKFTVLKDHDHDVWTDTYNNPAFYSWLFSHEKPD